jgi:hypothetical protein
MEPWRSTALWSPVAQRNIPPVQSRQCQLSRTAAALESTWLNTALSALHVPSPSHMLTIC